ncbi:spore gernimation protein KA [Peribacillus cavernae]|uniref:Spore gernimation protein KA n=1 Tax=Peribacillus cavernae TaxID=1674310 RepID=A0A3S0VL54_9BACI|nr:spore germination protein GerPB [Peribacillus cavernae]MDQ0217570.1 spore germination protein PB [Peribacillus cavernae]RUQ29996.1 spore gernimation protein KA [Peribacillus cavernae]
MVFHIQQSIQINMIKITNISNSSVFQIGSAGVIKPLSTQANTGQFTESAPQIGADAGTSTPFRGSTGQ